MNRRVLSLLLLSFLSIGLLLNTFSGTFSSENHENQIDTGVVFADVEQIAAGVGYVGGYASKVSAAQGETIDFHVSTNINGLYDLNIWYEGITRELKQTIFGLNGAQYNCVYGHLGCDWPAAATITIPTNWPSGAYTVDIPMQGSTQKILFWVRENNPGSTSRILFLSAINTDNAYTEYGGKSLYDFNSSNNEAAPKVSFNRPMRNGGVGNYFRWEGRFASWAMANGYDLEYAGDYDLEFIPDLLTHYDVLVIGGHSEYWTWNMRQRVKAFINNGGRLVNLSGNTMWWQIRYEDNGRTMVGYKAYWKDPIQDQTLVTENTSSYPVFDTEYAITGAYFPRGGYAPTGNLSYENGYGGFWVQHADHWVFANTHLENNDIFGRTNSAETAVIEHEVDGTTFNCAPDGATILGPLGNTGTPHNFTILAISPSYYKSIGFATMGIYTVAGGGAVFSGNTIGWATALEDPAVSQITKNVLDRFLNDATLPQEPAASADSNYLFYDRFNCNLLQNNGLQPAAPEWSSIPAHNYSYTINTSNAQYTNACGVDGSGLKITINEDNNMMFQSQVKPNWEGTNRLYKRMYLNLSKLSMAEGAQIELLRDFSDNRDGTQTLLGKIQLRWIDGAPQIRYRPSGPELPWLSVPANQPFLFEMLWDKDANLVSIWINDEQFDYSVNLADKPILNRVDLVLKGVYSNASGHICLDEFAFDDERIGAMQLNHYEVDITNSQAVTALPGDPVTFTHQLTNMSDVPDAFDFDVTSDMGWALTYQPLRTNMLMPGETAQLTVTIQVPPTVLANTVGHVSIQAVAASEKSEAAVSDTVAVEQVIGLSLSDPQSATGSPNQLVVISHDVINLGNGIDTFTVAATPDSSDWAISVYPSVIGPLAPGEIGTFEVAVQIPANLTDSDKTMVTVVAASQTDPAFETAVVDEVWSRSYQIFLPFVKN